MQSALLICLTHDPRHNSFSLFSQLSFSSVFFLFSLSGWLPCPGFLSLSSAVPGWFLGSLFAGHGRTFPPCPGLLSTFGRSLALASPYTTIFQDSFFAINQIRGRKRTRRNLSWDSLRHQSQRPEGICDSKSTRRERVIIFAA